MSIFLMIVGIAGWYFILSHFHIGAGACFTAFGSTFTWFTVLMLVGSLGIIKLCSKVK